jgi:hypothetical protein
VDDLATALAKENGPNASAITDVSLGGYPARMIVLTVPKGMDLATCQDKSYSWWSHPDEPGGWGPRIFFKPRVDTVYILDVEGTRQVVNAGICRTRRPPIAPSSSRSWRRSALSPDPGSQHWPGAAAPPLADDRA